MESLRRENKSLAQEVRDVTDQLGDGGKSMHDLQKARRRLEAEKEELQVCLNYLQSNESWAECDVCCPAARDFYFLIKKRFSLYSKLTVFMSDKINTEFFHCVNL